MKKLTFLFLLVFFYTIKSFAQPVGTVVAFAGPESKVPNGWVICDGRLFDRLAENGKYSLLFDAIGGTWGGDGANKFALPDLRGTFLRGVSGQSMNDPNSADRMPSRPDLPSQGNKGNTVGSKQNDQVGNIASKNTVFQQGNVEYSNPGNMVVLRAGNVFDAYTSSRPTEPISNGSETRPKNAYVFYIIKYIK